MRIVQAFDSKNAAGVTAPIMSKHTIAFGLLRRSIAALVIGTVMSAAAASDVVELFSPQGTVKQVRQVTARFTQPMVALGDPRLPDPFDIECPAKGHGRWADERNWVYDFDDDLPAGIRCTFTLRAGATSPNGVPIQGSGRFEFDTGGPSIRASLPYQGDIVDEDQVFLLALDSQATTASIERFAYCAIDGLAERIPLRVLTDTARTAILDQRRQLGYSYYGILWKDGVRSTARVRDRSLEQAEDRVVVLACTRRLPPDSNIKLVWGAGIAARSDIATTIDQQLSFRVRPAFTAHLECGRVNARAGCIPLEPIRLRFSAPVPTVSAMAVRIVTADGTTLAPTPAAADVATIEQLTFAPPFPDSQAVDVQLPTTLVDDIGRGLTNADSFPLEVKIDPYPPLAKFSGEFGILEANEGAVLPVSLRNVEAALPTQRVELSGRQLRETSGSAAIASWLRRVQEANAQRGVWTQDAKLQTSTWTEQTADRSLFGPGDATEAFIVPQNEPADVHNVDGKSMRPFEVVGIPLPERGFYVVELESRRLGEALLGRDQPRFVSTAVLVTNLSVHFKWGRESSRVWVTRLDDATPVDAVAIEISDACDGTVRWRGRTDHDGIAAIDVSFGTPHGNDNCGSPSPPLMISARTDDDFSFALSSWNEGIRPYDFALPIGGEWQTTIYHSVLDRPLYRVGETVSMKHFLRRHSIAGIELAQAAPGDHKVRITHLGSDARYERLESFDQRGTAVSSWQIPTEAKLGDYSIEINENADVWHASGRFKVEQFRLPTIRATVNGPAATQLRPAEVQLDLHATYLSGGGAAGLPVKLRTTIESRRIQFADYDDYTFGGEPVTEGITHTDGSAYDFEESATPDASVTARVFPLTLDDQGAARVTVPDIATIDRASVLNAEVDYADANGEILTAATRVPLWPAAINLGIRREGWVASTNQLRFRVAVLDLEGRPLADQRVDVKLYHATDYSYRKRLIGGFYAYESVREIKRLDADCSGDTDAQGLLTCELAPGVAGEVIVAARAVDLADRPAFASTSIWVVGQDEWWFGGTSGDRMDLLPEQKEYEPGDTARFQVRMPFRDATALVTVEREGVIDSFVTTLDGRNPIVEVPIKDAFSPNVFVSVLAVRGRVGSFSSWLADLVRRYNLPAFFSRDGGKPTTLIDLSKPSYRLGTAEIRVGWQPHRLVVSVEAEHPTYAVRALAAVKVHVARSDGTPLPAGAEVALAAVDEALLELAPNPSWDLLDAMLGRRGLEVWTATAQMEVVGKRHYGRKAVPHGGGGGRERARELFDTLLTWQGRVVLDAHGDARLTIPLNDSLTSFRIVAVASAGADLFGTGSTTIATTQDVLLLSGLPPLVREGDRYAATFTLRNTGDRAVAVVARAVTVPPLAQPLPTQQFDVAAGGARDFVWDVTAPIEPAMLNWEVAALDTAGKSLDRLKVAQRVIPAVPVRTFQATLAQLEQPLVMNVERPTDAIPGRGGLEVSLQSRLGDHLAGVHEFMSWYPYVCIEQNLSKAVALNDADSWTLSMERLPAYLDRNGLLKYFPADSLDGDDTLTAYVLSIGNEAGYSIPTEELQRMLAGLTAFVEGRIDLRAALPTADLSIRKLAAIEALSRYGAAQPRMLDSISIDPNNWPTSAVLDWLNVLGRLPAIPNSKQRVTEAEGIIRARLNFQGTTLGFSTERTDALWWLMISTDSNAVRALLTLMERPGWRADVPRLTRGAIGRQQSGHWNTTVANAWGVLAMRKFSREFESTPVSGTTKLAYGPFERSLAWTQDSSDLHENLPWHDDKSTLTLTQLGTGSPWATVRALAAIPLTAPLSTGFSIERNVTAVEQQRPDRWSRGDIVRVHIDVTARSDMTWVVVDDPIAAGATILGSGLGGQSTLATQGERSEGWAWLAYEQRAADAFRAYYRFVPKGRFSTEYTLRLNNPGTFQLPPTRVEAMYAPEMMGELPNESIVVEPAP